METLHIGSPKLTQDGKSTVLSAQVRNGSTETELWFRVPTCVNPTLSSDPFFATSLIPAMALGKTLEIDGTISPSLLSSSESVQDIFHNWFPELARIPVTAAPLSKSRETSGGVGCFFSGGIDSLYTFLKHEQEITTLIYVHGFDVSLNDTPLREQVSDALHSFSQKTGKKIIEIETNLREFTNQHGDWGKHTHGAALASIGLLLNNLLKRIYIPSTNSFIELFPWGSHPLTDPLWSTETTQFIHDGCEASRFEKVSTIATDDRALSTLRVCWENRKGEYNCGSCEKCLRTMTALEILGALNRCPTFSIPLNIDTIRQFELTTHIGQLHWNCNYESAIKYQRTDIATALKAAIDQYNVAKVINSLSDQFADVVTNPRWQEFTLRHREHLFLSLLKGNRRWLTREIILENAKLILGWHHKKGD